MIEILLDHSYEEDYFMISDVFVNVPDPIENERIKKLVKKCGLIGAFVDADNDLRYRIAKSLQVDANLIDIDTNDIDVY